MGACQTCTGNGRQEHASMIALAKDYCFKTCRSLVIMAEAFSSERPQDEGKPERSPFSSMKISSLEPLRYVAKTFTAVLYNLQAHHVIMELHVASTTQLLHQFNPPALSGSSYQPTLFFCKPHPFIYRDGFGDAHAKFVGLSCHACCHMIHVHLNPLINSSAWHLIRRMAFPIVGCCQDPDIPIAMISCMLTSPDPVGEGVGLWTCETTLKLAIVCRVSGFHLEFFVWGGKNAGL